MGALSGAMGGGGGFTKAKSADVISPFTGAQATDQYNAVNNQLGQQQQFLGQLQGQNALGNQSAVFNQQQMLANQLQQQAAGGGPNPAAAQLAQQTSNNTANQAALMAGQRGAGMNAGMLARQAAMQGSANQQNAIGQSATMQAQQQLNAQSQLAQQQQAMQQAATQQAGQLQNQYQTTGQQQLQAQQQLNSALGAQNSANIQNVTQQNQTNAELQKQQSSQQGGIMNQLGGAMPGLLKMAGGVAGGMFGGPIGASLGSSLAGSIAGGFGDAGGGGGGGMGGIMDMAGSMMGADGGLVPGQAPIPGKNDLRNDVVKARLSPGEVVIPLHIMDHPNAPELAKQFVMQQLQNRHSERRTSNFAEGGTVEADYSQPPQDNMQNPWAAVGQQIQSNGADMSKVMNAGTEAVFGPKPEETPVANMPLQAQQPQAASANQDPMAMAPALMQKDNMAMQGMNDQIQGIKAQAAAEGGLGQEKAGILEKQQAQQEQLMQSHAQEMAKLDNDRAGLMNEIKQGSIDPDKYMNNMTSGSKVGTAIGMLLSAVGSGVSGQPNAAMTFLNKQIETDIDAQKANLGRKQNLLDMTMKQYGNLKDATAFTKAMYADIYANKIEAAAAKSNNPMAKARAQQAIGALKAQYAPQMQEMAMRQAVMKGFQSGQVGPEQAVSTMVPEPHRAAVFKEIERAQNAQHAEKAVMSEFDKASKENTVMRRVGHMGAEPASLTNAMNLMMPVLKDNEGRINETEIKMMEDFMPKAGDSDGKIAQKRQGLMQFIQAKKAAPMAKGFGLDLERFNSTRTTSPNVKPYKK